MNSAAPKQTTVCFPNLTTTDSGYMGGGGVHSMTSNRAAYMSAQGHGTSRPGRLRVIGVLCCAYPSEKIAEHACSRLVCCYLLLTVFSTKPYKPFRPFWPGCCLCLGVCESCGA